MISKSAKKDTWASTRNACRLCTPFGACLAFRGIEGAMPLIHGSQGCSTYIRRYMIGHYREPMDIPCSNFSESSAVFGGMENLRLALKNVINQYRPSMIGVATTCLTETIGDDLHMFMHRITREWSGDDLPPVVTVSTPSYSGSHADGFHRAVRETVNQLAMIEGRDYRINLFCNMVSPEDIRYLKDIAGDYGVPAMILPDYSDTLDGGAWETYHRIPPGGTVLDDIQRAGAAQASIELGATIADMLSAAHLLEASFHVPAYRMGLPIGLKASDRLFDAFNLITGKATPPRYLGQRARLVDAYVDGHKYIFGKRVGLYGPEDLVIAMAGFVAEIGMIPVLCGSGGTSGLMAVRLREILGDQVEQVTIMENADFAQMEEQISDLAPDLLIGDSNGAKTARTLGIPLVRAGFPIHDRIGAARIMHLGYLGTQQLFDRIVNAVIEVKQESSPVGYTHM